MINQYTNLQQIPKGIFTAIAKDHYTDSNDQPSDYSATTLISPIQQTELKSRYRGTAKIATVDILDNYLSWIGSIIHNALEAALIPESDVTVERRFYRTISNNIISGKVDAIYKNKIVD